MLREAEVNIKQRSRAAELRWPLDKLSGFTGYNGYSTVDIFACEWKRLFLFINLFLALVINSTTHNFVSSGL